MRSPAPARATSEWTTAPAASRGFDPAALDRLTTQLKEGAFGNVHAVLIEKDGALVYEFYGTGTDERLGENLGTVTFNAASIHDLRSVGKSVMATLIGIALDQKRLTSVDQTLRELLPDRASQMSGPVQELRLRDLLTMSAGLRWNELFVSYRDPANDSTQLEASPDPVGFVLAREQEQPAGTRFNYNSGLTLVLAAILERATGLDVETYAQRYLFDPLGIEARNVVWQGDLGGLPDVAAGLRMRARDLAKLGSLYLHDGRWNGRQIVSSAWIHEATRPRISVHGITAPAFVERIGYGYQWWVVQYRLGHQLLEVPFMHGNGQQRVFLIRDRDLAVTVLAGHYNDMDPAVLWMPDRLLIKHILPALQ